MPDRMLITGGTGLLGTDLTQFFSSGYKVCSTGSRDLDIRDYDQLGRFFEDIQPAYVLHAAAIADVDRCEIDQKEAMAVNALGAENVARVCRESGAVMVYYSTDYVFNGEDDTPYTENDKTDPVNFYGRSKLEGEQRVMEILDNVVVLRIAWLFGRGEKCFIARLIERGVRQIGAGKTGGGGEEIVVISDQIGTPTYTRDIARQTEALLRGRMSGLFHCTSEGETSRQGVAEIIFERLNMKVELTVRRRDEFQWRAPRPAYTVLENAGLNECNMNLMPDFRTAINRYLEDRSDNNNIRV